MANLRTNNLSGEQGQNAIRGSVTFGGYVDGVASDYLSVADHDDFNMGQGEFTFECWLLAVPHAGASYDPNYMGIASSQNYTTDGFLIQVANDGQLRLVGPLSGGAYFQQSAGPSLFNDDWNHIAVVRTSGTIKGFVNGIEVISASQGTNIDFSLGGSFNIGENGYSQYPGDYPFRGIISNLRLTKGLARYTADFTPPTTELTADADTVLLCCQDSDNPFQEETGKTITGFGRYYPDTGELFTDTGFNTTNAWTGAGSNGWTVNGDGVATHAQGTAGDLFQQITNLVVGQTYKLEVDVLTSDDDVAYFYVDNNPGGSYPALGNASNARVGHYELYFRANATSMYLGFRGSSLFAGTITNLRLQSYGIGLNPKMPEIIPPCGRDAGNAFGGAIQQSTEGYMYFPTGRTEERVIVNNNFGARGLIMGGITYPGTSFVNVIESIQIASLGNSVDFGDLTNKPNGGGGFSSKTRGFVVGGNTPDGYGLNVIQFVTIATAGNAQDFGDVGYSRANPRGVSNNTRGVYSGGESASSPYPSINNIEFVTMSTTGNGTDFGDLVDAGSSYATASSPTRGVHLGGYRDGEVNFIDFITIATTGNSQQFGDLVNTSRNGNGGASNGHRGIVMGGYASPARTNTIQYVTIQSTGNAIDFGDLTDARDPAVTSSLTRGIACTGDYPSNVNIIDFIEIMTTGNAVDFGDMLTKTSSAQTCSNAHGGLADDM